MHGWAILAQTSTDGIWQFRPEFLIALAPVVPSAVRSLRNAFGSRNRQGRASDRIRRYLHDPSRPGGLRKALRSVSCLRPVRGIDPEEIRRLRRIPLEYNLGMSRLSDLWVYPRLFFLGPSYPKPAFAITDCEIVPESTIVRQQQDARHRQAFTAGGYRLNISLDHGESRRHFIRSMVLGAAATGRTVVVCSPEDLAHRWNPVRCFDVYAAPGQSRAQPFPVVTLFSRDPLFSGKRHGKYSSPGSVPDGAIWLVDLGPRGTEEGGLRGGVAARKAPGLPRQFPVPVWRRFVYLVTFAALAFLVIRIVLLANFSIGSPDVPEWYDTLAVVSCVYLLVPATIWYLVKVTTYVASRNGG